MRTVLVFLALTGCGASGSDAAFTAVGVACDQLEERVTSGGSATAAQELACLEHVCNEILTAIDPEAASALVE